jgi:hypothetical protein
MRCWRWAIAAAAVVCAAGPASARQEPDPEREARLARSGAGLRAGAWFVTELREVVGATTSTWPYAEGYFQRGIDRHLVVESTLGVWRRRESHPGSPGIGGAPPQTVTAYVVPLLTALKFYPATGPDASFGPYAKAGAGFALGIEDRQGGAGGLLGGRGGGTSIETGFGVGGELGADFRLSPAFGLTVGGRYQWLRFGSDVGGNATFGGFGLVGGLTYRFRY